MANGFAGGPLLRGQWGRRGRLDARNGTTSFCPASGLRTASVGAVVGHGATERNVISCPGEEPPRQVTGEMAWMRLSVRRSKQASLPCVSRAVPPSPEAPRPPGPMSSPIHPNMRLRRRPGFEIIHRTFRA